MNCESKQDLQSCLLRVPIFKNIDTETFKNLHDLLCQKKYDKGVTIFREGDPAESLFFVNKGIIKITKLSDKGKEHILRFLFSGDFFGQFALLPEQFHYANATALEDVEICTIHRNDFKNMLLENPQISYQFLLELIQKLHETDEWITNISLLEVERRLAKLLIYFYKRDSKTSQILNLPVAKQELAALIGTTPETISRKLSHFESLGLLELIGRTKIRLLDPMYFEAFLNEP